MEESNRATSTTYSNTHGILIGLCVVIGLFLARELGLAIYNVYFHPLSHIPGPKLYAASHIPHTRHTLSGRKPWMFLRLHEKYGDVVRYSPHHVSFSNPAAFKEILNNKPGRGQLMKDPKVYSTITSGAHSILSAPSDADHSRYRRLLSHGFSEKAMREQESVVMEYVDLLIQRLHEYSKNGSQDMVAWYNWTTFDLIGDLTFNESFDCLEKATYDPWIAFVFSNVKAGAILSGLKLFPFIDFLINKLFGKQINEKKEQNAAFTKRKVAGRLTANTDRTDFLGYVLRHKGKETEMSIPEIEATSSILVLGGSETTATLLAGVTYLLLKNPRVMNLLVAEITGKFKKEEEINIVSVNTLTYQLAVLEEALRLFPPVAFGSARVIPPQGDIILGYKISAGTTVVATNFANCHYSRHWKDAESFVPERWLDDPRYKDDKRGAAQPFSVGPRNCIGRNLAYAEMRIILARIIWNFEMELSESSKTWMENLKVFNLWQKDPLMVNLKPRWR